MGKHEKLLALLNEDVIYFDEALSAYQNTDICNPAQLLRYQRRGHADFMRSHIVGTLEIYAGVPESGRMAEPGSRPAAETEEAHQAAETDEFGNEPSAEPHPLEIELSFDVKQMSPEQRKLIMRNRSLQREIDKQQAALFATGEANTPELSSKRESIIAKIEILSKEQVANWRVLNPEPTADTQPDAETLLEAEAAIDAHAEMLEKINELNKKLGNRKRAAITNKTHESREKAAADARVLEEELRVMQQSLNDALTSAE